MLLLLYVLLSYSAEALIDLIPSSCFLKVSQYKIDYKLYSIRFSELENCLGFVIKESDLIHLDQLIKKKVIFLKEENKARKQVDNRKLLFISCEIKSSFFDMECLGPNILSKLIEVYKNYGIDLKKDVIQKSSLEILYRKSNSSSEEKILYTSLATGNKAISLYYYKSKEGIEGYFNREGIGLKSSTFVSPIGGDFRISSKFGSRKHPIRGKVLFHKGVDYAAKLGTPISATADGVIEYIGENSGYGNFIKIKHNNKYSTCYAHISKFSRDIKLGSKVKQGKIIAYVGSTGTATGPHLHYEVIYDGRHIDPLTMFDRTEKKLLNHELIEFKLLVSKLDEVIKNSKKLDKKRCE